MNITSIPKLITAPLSIITTPTRRNTCLSATATHTLREIKTAKRALRKASSPKTMQAIGRNVLELLCSGYTPKRAMAKETSRMRDGKSMTLMFLFLNKQRVQ